MPFQNHNSENLVGHTFTKLDDLTVSAVLDARNSEDKIFNFLSEDAILERTKNCKSYFDNFVTANAVANKNSSVSLKLFFAFVQKSKDLQLSL